MQKRWSVNDYKKYFNKKNNQNSNKPKKKLSLQDKLNSVKTKKKGAKQKRHIYNVLLYFKSKSYIDSFLLEHRFDEVRRFKFDYAILSYKIAIEYEGLMSKKSGHTTVTGFTKDCEKYNLAQINGWTVLRYTALNYKNIERDLLKAIQNKGNNNNNNIKFEQ